VGKAVLSLILSLCVGFAAAQDTDAAGKAAQKRAPRPLWSELSPKQQAVLAPLAADWEHLDTTRRKKWVTIANRYPKLKSEEQARLQERMQAWAKLTPEQRRVARDNYRALNQIPPAERGEVKQKWRQDKAPSRRGDAEKIAE
jgi:hypothetical protein